MYYREQKAEPKLQQHFVAPIKAMIEENPSFGYRTVAGLLGLNKNTVQRIFQLKGWQVKKRSVGFRPRVQRRLQSRSGQMSVGPPICAVSGRERMAGVTWHW